MIETPPYVLNPTELQLKDLRARLMQVPEIYAQGKATLVEGTHDRWITGESTASRMPQWAW